MSTNGLVHSLQKFFKVNDKTTFNTEIKQHQTQSAAELLAFISIVKLELHKLENGEKSFFGDLKALKSNVIPDAINLCDYATNIIIGNPVDDNLFELEKIIVMLYSLPHDSQFDALMSKIFIGLFWNQLPHPPASFQNQAGYQWRSADGSNNNLAFPNIGKSGQKYIQDCLSRRPQSDTLPDPGLIFDELLKRCAAKNGEFRASECGISSNFIYFATLITHDLFNTDGTNKSINTTTSYLDLSPLYGSTKQIQYSIRTGKNGLLKQDQYADTRLWIQPAGVTAFIILFSRNHNYLAETLLKIDENSRFSSLEDKQRDEALFQTARLINERTYMNIILHDYLRVILGINRAESSWTLDPLQDFSNVGSGGNIPIATGNQCSLEFNFLYRWHHATSIEDEKWLESKLSSVIGNWKEMDMKTMFEKLGEVKQDQQQNPQLVRRKDGRFRDKDLAKILIDGCKNVSGAFGGQNTPAVFRNIEISSILQARSLGLCTLNEYRSHLKLKKYQSFEELNPDLSERVAKLYKTIDDVELYPGVLFERKKPAIDGNGLCPNYTTGFAILSDVVALVRGDRFYSKDATYFNLTNFGMDDSQSIDTIDYGTLIGRKLIARHLSSVYTQNNVYATFPFTLSSETWKNLGKKQTNYDFTVPR
jgi:linoleate 8R-lipoxygenase/9,12-octadecadienoate 8-hydroperoxide 8R-isomerase/linoleate 8R-lipoxygenase/9,12-octadecadienoate 8-hydroperoxide 8S-isomerase